MYVLATYKRGNRVGHPISVVLMPELPPPFRIWGRNFLCLLAEQETMLFHIFRCITLREGGVCIVATDHYHPGIATHCVA